MANRKISLDNQQARHLWLHLQGLLAAPSLASGKYDFLQTIQKLGMVQLDSITNVVRAHHHILWSRHSGYRDRHYNTLLGHNPEVFEHFSHDAVILPLNIFPFWQRQQIRRSSAFTRGTLGEQLPGKKIQQQLLASIRERGPMCSRDFAAEHVTPADKSRHAWMRPPHKQALDYLWLKGDLCVSHREGFIKYYELAERAIPAKLRQTKVSIKNQIDTLCESALERLGIGTARDIQAFYDACTLDEVKRWIKRSPDKHLQATIQTHSGATLELLARPDIENIIQDLPKPSQRLRVVNPFDPVVRDRKKLQWLFGMEYRIEIYVPANKRRYGYYVYPLMENGSVVGRIDVSANRQLDTLAVKNWWLEPGVRHSTARTQRLTSELARLAKMANLSAVSTIPEPAAHR